MDSFFLETLPAGKKISLFASFGVAFLMLTAFVGSLSISRGNGFDWVAWVGYFASFGYAVVVLLNGIDLKDFKGILRLSTLALTFIGTIAMIMDFSGATGGLLFSMLMTLLAFAASGAVVVIEYVKEQQFNLVYCLISAAFFILNIFLAICEVYALFEIAGRPPIFGLKIAYVLATLLFTGAAGYNCYKIVKEEQIG